jgi:hypothetical protein
MNFKKFLNSDPFELLFKWPPFQYFLGVILFIGLGIVGVWIIYAMIFGGTRGNDIPSEGPGQYDELPDW